MIGPSEQNHINAFWRAFVESEAELARSIAQKDAGGAQGLMLELHRSLVKVHAALGFEFGSEADDRLDLCITADGDVKAFEAAREVVSAAPRVPRWNIHCFRQRKDLANMTIAVGEFATEAKDVRYLANFASSKLDIVLLYDLADDMDPQLLYTISVLMLDAALGEFDAATGIASLDAVNGRHPKSLPFLELPTAFDAWRAKVAN